MDLKALNLLAMEALHYGKLTRAEDLIAQLAQARPGHPQVVLLAGMLRARQGRHQDAIKLLESLLQLRPKDPGILLYLGNALQGLGRYEQALQRYDSALAVTPDSAEILGNRGNALAALERFDEALASHDAALRLETRDENLWCNRGILLLKVKRNREALEDFERALAIRPDFIAAVNGKGNALLSLHQPAQALACFRTAIQSEPDNANFLMNHAAALVHLNRYGEAFADYERIRSLDPDFPKLGGQMALAALYDCDWPRMAAIAADLPARIREGTPGYDPWTLMGYGLGEDLLLQCARNRLRESLASASPLWTGQVYRHERLRLAYVSSDFRNHPVGFQVAEVLERHNRARFEVIGVSCGEDDGSDIRARLIRAFDQFHDFAGRSDDEVARLLRKLEVDIAVDLSGHTHGNRLGAFAHRPAPVQATWLGHPGTTGADFMNYIIADAVVVPPGHRRHYSEKVIALPDCYFPLDGSKLLGACPTRAECGLPEKGFVFCNFNRDWKITPALFDIWLRLLAQVPGSVLWLRAPIFTAALHLPKRAKERGIDPARLVFADQAPPEIHLARHALADLFLDSLPYGAHATAADALLAGLPVLTQMGGTFAGRVGASMLSAAGLPELITHCEEDYEATALALAREPARLRELRDRLSANRNTAPFFDTARFTRNLEAAYEAMLAEKSGL